MSVWTPFYMSDTLHLWGTYNFNYHLLYRLNLLLLPVCRSISSSPIIVDSLALGLKFNCSNNAEQLVKSIFRSFWSQISLSTKISVCVYKSLYSRRVWASPIVQPPTLWYIYKSIYINICLKYYFGNNLVFWCCVLFFFHFAFLDTSIISINPGFYWPVSPSCQVPYPVRALQNILFSLNILSADGPDLNSTGRARNESTQLLSNRCVQGRNKI